VRAVRPGRIGGSGVYGSIGSAFLSHQAAIRRRCEERDTETTMESLVDGCRETAIWAGICAFLERLGE
jgi:hypothetical protein